MPRSGISVSSWFKRSCRKEKVPKYQIYASFNWRFALCGRYYGNRLKKGLRKSVEFASFEVPLFVGGDKYIALHILAAAQLDCGKEITNVSVMTMDHIVSKYLGGSSKYSNLGYSTELKRRQFRLRLPFLRLHCEAEIQWDEDPL